MVCGMLCWSSFPLSSEATSPSFQVTVSTTSFSYHSDLQMLVPNYPFPFFAQTQSWMLLELYCLVFNRE